MAITGSAIAHIEQGRMDISRARIEAMLAAYEYTREEYLAFFDGASLPINLRDECSNIIRQLDDGKLQVVHSVLVNLMPPGTSDE